VFYGLAVAPGGAWDKNVTLRCAYTTKQTHFFAGNPMIDKAIQQYGFSQKWLQNNEKYL